VNAPLSGLASRVEAPAGLMVRQHIHRVVEDEALVGVVTSMDLAALLAERCARGTLTRRSGFPASYGQSASVPQ
jgi:hypothetical protein